jgi:hypothetical protein
VSNVTALTGSGCAVREVENKVTIKEINSILKTIFSFGFELNFYKI